MDEDQARWEKAYNRAFTGTTREQKDAITDAYWPARKIGKGAAEALEYAVNEVLGPLPEPEGTSEYEIIMAGEEIWVSTLKNSVS